MDLLVILLISAQLMLFILKACDVGGLIEFAWSNPVLYIPLMICAVIMVLQIIVLFILKDND